MQSVVQFAAPEMNVCRDFLSIRDQATAPFRGTFVGVVADVEDMAWTSTGAPKRRFKLVDRAGAFLQCCALAHSVGNRAVQTGAQVIVYHGTGRAAIGNQEGQIYLMKDALVIAFGRQDSPPQPRIQIAIE